MKNICAVCGKELGGYYSVNFNDEVYKVCEKCKIAIKKGIVSFDNISLDKVKNIEESIKKEENRIERKKEAQKNDPLYEDIHQIAGDLRFLKNIVIAGLVLSIISGIFTIVALAILF